MNLDAFRIRSFVGQHEIKDVYGVIQEDYAYPILKPSQTIIVINNGRGQIHKEARTGVKLHHCSGVHSGSGLLIYDGDLITSGGLNLIARCDPFKGLRFVEIDSDHEFRILPKNVFHKDFSNPNNS